MKGGGGSKKKSETLRVRNDPLRPKSWLRKVFIGQLVRKALRLTAAAAAALHLFPFSSSAMAPATTARLWQCTPDQIAVRPRHRRRKSRFLHGHSVFAREPHHRGGHETRILMHRPKGNGCEALGSGEGRPAHVPLLFSDLTHFKSSPASLPLFRFVPIQGFAVGGMGQQRR